MNLDVHIPKTSIVYVVAVILQDGSLLYNRGGKSTTVSLQLAKTYASPGRASSAIKNSFAPLRSYITRILQVQVAHTSLKVI